MFVQKRGSSGSEPTKTSGRQTSVSSAWVAPMMNRGLAERWASCFWKTLETGLARILAATNRAVSMSHHTGQLAFWLRTEMNVGVAWVRPE
jgi:hypothetical protein